MRSSTYELNEREALKGLAEILPPEGAPYASKLLEFSSSFRYTLWKTAVFLLARAQSGCIQEIPRNVPARKRRGPGDQSRQ